MVGTAAAAEAAVVATAAAVVVAMEAVVAVVTAGMVVATVGPVTAATEPPVVKAAIVDRAVRTAVVATTMVLTTMSAKRTVWDGGRTTAPITIRAKHMAWAKAQMMGLTMTSEMIGAESDRPARGCTGPGVAPVPV
ncbi:hypothetical protein Pres01_41180 [Metapseudomonas resinovorans]|nr:hypothetical protein Pres01_41180 [Pseudomonas resinovorans]